MTNSTLTISNVLQRNTGSYQCRADNDVSSVTSTTATLSIASKLIAEHYNNDFLASSLNYKCRK